MPVPNARILNPFVPRDDLGIEEDISNKIYLPSDVSLSLATMVGRNGRKPRIVQMDDDGNVYVSVAPRTYVGGLREFIPICTNKHFDSGDTTDTYDIRGVSILVLAYIVTHNDSGPNPLTIAQQCMGIDKTTVIATNGLGWVINTWNVSVASNIQGSGVNAPYFNLLFGSAAPPNGGTVSAEMYLG